LNKIIVLPGTADAIFFINEVDYIKKYFDEIVIISYPGNEENFIKLSKEKGFKYYVVRDKILKSLLDTNFYIWLFKKETLKEIRNAFSFTKQGLSKFIYILYYGLFYINAKKHIDKELEKNVYGENYLYSFWLTRGAYTVANYNLNRENNIKKLLSRAHGYDLYEERNKTNYLPFREYIDKNLDEIHFISKHGREYFNNKYPYSNQRAKKSISRLGTFNPNTIRKKVFNKCKICIASCSSIIPIKRLDLIIDIIANIDIPVEWIHLGTGDQESKIVSYALEKLEGIEYHFLGQVDNSEILKAYERYDVDFFINMSDSEGVPVSIMEALSLGIPVIARDVGGISEIVTANTGLLIEDISNPELVYYQVNQEVRQRMEDIESYNNKQEECIKLWDVKYNADRNYTNIFSGMC
jgi:colanic acid/amylovoran biosynthesis glycosyltransferase